MALFPHFRVRAALVALLLAGVMLGAGPRFSPALAAQAHRGNTSPALARFSNPYGLTVDVAGNIYVVDSDAYKVIKLSRAGKVLAKWGTKGDGPGQFAGPQQVAVDRHGIVYVSDYEDDRVERFTPSGKFLGQWGKKGSDVLSGADGIALGPDGNIYIGVADGVVEYSPGGKHLASFRVANEGLTHGVAVDHQGNIYTCDYFGYIVKVTPHGRLLAQLQWHDNSKGVGGTNDASGVAVSPRGILYVADTGYDRIDTFTSGLHPLGLLGKAGGSGRGQFSGPNGVAVGPDGDIYVADSNNSRVQKLTPSGKVLAVWT